MKTLKVPMDTLDKSIWDYMYIKKNWKVIFDRSYRKKDEKKSFLSAVNDNVI